MYSVFDVANWFLLHNKSEVENGADGISNLKLQKLLYYAQGANLALNGEVLFNESIYAWKHGPVVQEVYYKFSKCGAESIPVFDEIETPKIGESETNILEQVYDVFGQFSAWKLRDLTHQETPWIETKQSEIIEPSKIKKYFIEHYVIQNDEE